ncbi:hypothetical protein EVAR_99371_1 [Eumeta japonica]|uniref:Solute carrier family 23 member 2 n=1 Tax=Eumeta variegata TaxID=151549 RepID=A0A4C1YLS1_EUMVA|nr:hypothetical protein EVAR_99371_1 [Eumeta japonica]
MVQQTIQIGMDNMMHVIPGDPQGADALSDPNVINVANVETASNDGSARDGNVTYGIDDVPPWYLCLFMALQHYLTMIGAIVAIPFILCPALCMLETDPDRSNIISTMIFVTGLVTWLQTTFGCRLPIVQGGTISFLVPTLAILGLPMWRCPPTQEIAALDDAARKELWMIRMRELSGAIAVAALAQMFMGYFGIIGSVLRFVTPLTIAPTVALVGLTLFDHAASAASQQWGIAAGRCYSFDGRIVPLCGTPFCFKVNKSLSSRKSGTQKGYRHWCTILCFPEMIAELRSSNPKRRMITMTDLLPSQRFENPEAAVESDKSAILST